MFPACPDGFQCFLGFGFGAGFFGILAVKVELVESLVCERQPAGASGGAVHSPSGRTWATTKRFSVCGDFVSRTTFLTVKRPSVRVFTVPTTLILLPFRRPTSTSEFASPAVPAVTLPETTSVWILATYVAFALMTCGTGTIARSS